ncbi:uncharacterized protein LOC106175202 [Lingula anatina]|uniref:Uncharacterized protein LOC106175202 n=1 Tax=Lingula anatina TaxID=7574 RepID=A0A1S3JQ99_LINAN|nr:uncharacterized protein LOC106175202 [Lingula anatina]|eukprot:XP_013412537.1 uncharacterized protein LOC106175202 [Lingula anatina]
MAADGKPPKPEASVLTQLSLSNLARHVDDGMWLGMYLNIPTGTIVNFKNDYNRLGWTDAELAEHILLYWKSMRVAARDKDKVAELERAIRDIEKIEIADTLGDRFRNNQELTTDCFN